MKYLKTYDMYLETQEAKETHDILFDEELNIQDHMKMMNRQLSEEQNLAGKFPKEDTENKTE